MVESEQKPQNTAAQDDGIKRLFGWICIYIYICRAHQYIHCHGSLATCWKSKQLLTRWEYWRSNEVSYQSKRCSKSKPVPTKNNKPPYRCCQLPQVLGPGRQVSSSTSTYSAKGFSCTIIVYQNILLLLLITWDRNTLGVQMSKRVLTLRRARRYSSVSGRGCYATVGYVLLLLIERRIRVATRVLSKRNRGLFECINLEFWNSVSICWGR